MRLQYLFSRERHITNFLSCNSNSLDFQPYYPTNGSFFKHIMEGNITDCNACLAYYKHIRMGDINKFQLLNRLIVECYKFGFDMKAFEENVQLLKILACSLQVHPILLGQQTHLGHPDEACYPYKLLYYAIYDLPNAGEREKVETISKDDIRRLREILKVDKRLEILKRQDGIFTDNAGEKWQNRFMASHNLYLCKTVFQTFNKMFFSLKDTSLRELCDTLRDIDPDSTEIQKYQAFLKEEKEVQFQALKAAILAHNLQRVISVFTLNEDEKMILEPLLSYLRTQSIQKTDSKKIFKIKESKRKERKKQQRRVKQQINAPKQVASKEVYKTTEKKDHMDETQELVNEELLKLNEGDVLEEDWNHILDAQHEYLDSESEEEEEEEDNDEVIEENIAQELEENSQPSISFKDWPLDKKSRYLHPSSFTQIEYEEVKLKRHQKKVDALFHPERHITITWQTFVVLWNHIGGKIIGAKNGGSHRKIIGPNSEFLGSICIPHAKQYFKSNIPHLQTLALYVGLRPTN